MKRIAIFCRSLAADGHPFKNEYYYDAYFDVLLGLKTRGVAAYFVTHGSYAGKGVFREAYTADAKVPLAKLTRERNVKMDLVFDKGGFEAVDVMVLNPPEVHQVTASKGETYRLFGKYQPTTTLCTDRAEVEVAAAALPGDMIVVKEPDEYVDGVVSNGGKFVYIGARAEVLGQLPDRYPLLVQEFVDTSVGVPGLTEGAHDVRVEIGGGEIWGGTLRIPPAGQLKANVAQGAERRRLTPAELPPEVKKLALEIDKHFAAYPRHYSLDFIHGRQGWKLIELNNNPGLSPIDFSPQAEYITGRLIEYLIDICP
ncbi:MAG TPA: hypothetical protein VHQ86_00870 [Candidatus Saccharimonadia bacterium]|nr:hypothetical protein [Candidatus Saccharimonadia bacterium]